MIGAWSKFGRNYESIARLVVALVCLLRGVFVCVKCTAGWEVGGEWGGDA